MWTSGTVGEVTVGWWIWSLQTEAADVSAPLTFPLLLVLLHLDPALPPLLLPHLLLPLAPPLLQLICSEHTVTSQQLRLQETFSENKPYF